MQRVSNQHFEDFPATTLYIEDVAELIDTFALACKQVEVSSGQFKIVDPAELQLLAGKFPTGRFAELKIQGNDPYVSLELRPYGARAYISEDSLEQRGIVSKAREVIHRRKKLQPELPANIVIVLLLSVGIWQLYEKSFAIAVPVLLSVFAAFSYSVRLRMRNTVVVYSKSHADVKSFFQRKKDDILLAVISAAFGAAASYAATKLLP